jgi:hypothetical protein
VGGVCLNEVDLWEVGKEIEPRGRRGPIFNAIEIS